MTITVEEARTLLGEKTHSCCELLPILRGTGTAFIFADIFDEYSYRSENPAPTPQSQDSQNGEQLDNAAFEIPLNTLIECLNIFGTAGPASTNANGTGKYKKWKKTGEDSDHDDENEGGGGGGRGRNGGNARGIESYFAGGSEKRTGMRMTYAGSGYPLTLLM
jgi:cell cycle checkpoint protein